MGNKALVVDSSGLSIVDAGKWQRSKHGSKSRRQWRKVHIAVVSQGQIISSKLTGRKVDDASVVPDLLDHAGKLTKFTIACRDSARGALTVYLRGQLHFVDLPTTVHRRWRRR